MRPSITAVLASAPLALASQTVFSVHDDILAFPQYEVIFSDSFISDAEADVIIAKAQSTVPTPPQPSDTSIQYSTDQGLNTNTDYDFNPASETYELMWLNNEQYLCTIPVVESPAKNETSEAEARAAEQKELARATDRGWELLQELEENCLYFVSGWWSYAFCYNADITQFHALPPQPGKPPFPPQRDPNTKEFVLGKARPTSSKKSKGSQEDVRGKSVDLRTPAHSKPPNTELQTKGDTRYLVQKMEGGTLCDLTGKPRRVEVQYHCNPHVTDRIGYIKEVTTCAYLLVIYTPRLCNDVAFMPPKENKAHTIQCRVVVPDDELLYAQERKALEDKRASAEANEKIPINIGGVILGGGRFHSSEGERMPTPPNFADVLAGRAVEVIARAKSKAEGGKVEMLSDAELAKMDLDPEIIDGVRKEIQTLAKDKGWKIEVVDAPGQQREILGIVDPDSDEDGEEQAAVDSEEGSEEVYKDEL
ncbi:glucosidase II beta subunit-like protein [Phlyctema vagabunda]|uniref:Endoplasmic reticulum lectin n=1 Tax=Phlyctema vagabunda TaxID=108571 RepID=A0ABR4PTP8_9HELO